MNIIVFTRYTCTSNYTLKHLTKVGALQPTLRCLLRVRLWALLAKAPLAAANRQSIPHRLERWRSTSLSYGELMPAYSTILRTMRLRVFFTETQDVHSISRISSPRP